MVRLQAKRETSPPRGQVPASLTIAHARCECRNVLGDAVADRIHPPLLAPGSEAIVRALIRGFTSGGLPGTYDHALSGRVRNSRRRIDRAGYGIVDGNARRLRAIATH